LAPIRAILPPAAIRIALSGEGSRKFFLNGESAVPDAASARRGRVRHAVKRQRAHRQITLMHHRRGHLTGISATLQIRFADAAAIGNAREFMSAREGMRRREGVRDDATPTFR
jgi:hypothetical protein